jgi:hypothetical protein
LSVEDLTRGGENEEELTLRLEMETKKSVDDEEEDEMWNDGRMRIDNQPNLIPHFGHCVASSATSVPQFSQKNFEAGTVSE